MFQVVLITFVGVVGALACMGLGVYFLLLSNPPALEDATADIRRRRGRTATGMPVDQRGEDSMVVLKESTQWINDILINWLGTMLMTGATGSPQLLSDRLCYVIAQSLSPKSAAATGSADHQHNMSSGSGGGGFKPGGPPASNNTLSNVGRFSDSVSSSSQSDALTQQQSVASTVVGTRPSSSATISSLNNTPQRQHTNLPHNLNASSSAAANRRSSMMVGGRESTMPGMRASSVSHAPKAAGHHIGHRCDRPEPRLKSLRLGTGPGGVPKVPVMGEISSSQSWSVSGGDQEGCGHHPSGRSSFLELSNREKRSAPDTRTSGTGIQRRRSQSMNQKRQQQTESTSATTSTSRGDGVDGVTSYHFKIPFSYDDLSLDATLDCDVPLFMGLGPLLAADLATMHADLEVRTIRLDAVLSVTVEGTDRIYVGLASLPRWESKISTKFGSKNQLVNGGSKIEEICKLAINRALNSFVVPRGYCYEAAGGKWRKVT